MLVLKTPTQLRLPGYEGRQDLLSKELAYTDKKFEWALRKFKAGRRWFVPKHGEQAYELRLAELKAQASKTALFQDSDGLWTYSGLKSQVSEVLGDDDVRREYDLPGQGLVPWASAPKYQPRYYQSEAVVKLLAAAPFGPAGIEHGTGLGKSMTIEILLKRLGLQAIVMAPSTSIAEQLFDEMVRLFGKSRVGFFGDGKKQRDKLFTVGIGASLTTIAEGSPAWNSLSQAKVFIADESHMTASATLERVCLGLAANAPYRFFFSGTQLRADGLDLVLQGITGPIVHRMTVREGVDQDFLARPEFRMCWFNSDVRFDSDDANELTRAHVYYNPTLNRKAAELINKTVSVMGRPTLVLVQELKQAAFLLPHLRYPARFAHGGVTAENREKVPEQFWESDPKALVRGFNAGEFPILIGTSCISTGTDLTATKAMFYLQGGKSEVKVRQAVGRCTRLVPGKTDCFVFDFGVSNSDTLKRHATERRAIYRDIYPSYREVQL